MDLPTLYAQCAPNVAPQTLAAIVRVESGGNPWRIGINGNYTLPRQPQNKAEAVREANRLIGLGYNIDLGLMQINVKNLGMLNLSVDEVFDAGAQILQNFYLKSEKDIGQGQTSLKRAISAYHTGNFHNGFANGNAAKITGSNGDAVGHEGVIQAIRSGSVVAWARE
ncbi:MAG: hypothetical protein B7Y58_09505 [Halothiobacillus sp. 35-54-62]|nr:MAG: hypothetical protein B7Y58_09505 [Halothiobacillus sp. 35-54-62]